MSNSNQKSFAWQYFVKSNEEESANYSKCGKKILCKGWSTSGLVRHLKNIHIRNLPILWKEKLVILKKAVV